MHEIYQKADLNLNVYLSSGESRVPLPHSIKVETTREGERNTQAQSFQFHCYIGIKIS